MTAKSTAFLGWKKLATSASAIYIPDTQPLYPNIAQSTKANQEPTDTQAAAPTPSSPATPQLFTRSNISVYTPPSSSSTPLTQALSLSIGPVTRDLPPHTPTTELEYRFFAAAKNLGIPFSKTVQYGYKFYSPSESKQTHLDLSNLNSTSASGRSPYPIVKKITPTPRQSVILGKKISLLIKNMLEYPDEFKGKIISTKNNTVWLVGDMDISPFTIKAPRNTSPTNPYAKSTLVMKHAKPTLGNLELKVLVIGKSKDIFDTPLQELIPSIPIFSKFPLMRISKNRFLSQGDKSTHEIYYNDYSFYLSIKIPKISFRPYLSKFYIHKMTTPDIFPQNPIKAIVL